MTYFLQDVYHDDSSTFPPRIPLFLEPDFEGGFVVSDHEDPSSDFGTFNFLVENRNGEPFLTYWHEEDFGNDPRFTINLKTGELTTRRRTHT